MAGTTNLNMTVINGSDFVSPDPINQNFAILDVLGLDYIVESGTSGEWWYRKWKSGRAECGIDDKEFPDQSHTTGWGAMFITPVMNFGSYPFSFAARPYVSILFNSNLDGGHNSYISTQSSTSTTQTPSFHLVDPNSGSIRKPHFGIYVCGRYK